MHWRNLELMSISRCTDQWTSKNYLLWRPHIDFFLQRSKSIYGPFLQGVDAVQMMNSFILPDWLVFDFLAVPHSDIQAATFLRIPAQQWPHFDMACTVPNWPTVELWNFAKMVNLSLEQVGLSSSNMSCLDNFFPTSSLHILFLPLRPPSERFNW